MKHRYCVSFATRPAPELLAQLAATLGGTIRTSIHGDEDGLPRTQLHLTRPDSEEIRLSPVLQERQLHAWLDGAATALYHTTDGSRYEKPAACGPSGRFDSAGERDALATIQQLLYAFQAPGSTWDSNVQLVVSRAAGLLRARGWSGPMKQRTNGTRAARQRREDEAEDGEALECGDDCGRD